MRILIDYKNIRNGKVAKDMSWNFLKKLNLKYLKNLI